MLLFVWVGIVPNAGVAQTVERLPCKQDVTGSIPVASSNMHDRYF